MLYGLVINQSDCRKASPYPYQLPYNKASIHVNQTNLIVDQLQDCALLMTQILLECSSFLSTCHRVAIHLIKKYNYEFALITNHVFFKTSCYMYISQATRSRIISAPLVIIQDPYCQGKPSGNFCKSLIYQLSLGNNAQWPMEMWSFFDQISSKSHGKYVLKLSVNPVLDRSFVLQPC